MAEESIVKEEESTGEMERPKPGRLWIKNSRGQASATLTFMTVAFIIVSLSYIASMFTQIGPLTMRAFDAGACAAFFIPLLALYGGRKYTDAKYRNSDTPGS